MLARARDAVETRVAALRGQAAPARVPASAEFLERLMVLGDVMADAGLLVPGNAVAVYRAR